MEIKEKSNKSLRIHQETIFFQAHDSARIGTLKEFIIEKLHSKEKMLIISTNSCQTFEKTNTLMNVSNIICIQLDWQYELIHNILPKVYAIINEGTVQHVLLNLSEFETVVFLDNIEVFPLFVRVNYVVYLQESIFEICIQEKHQYTWMTNVKGGSHEENLLKPPDNSLSGIIHGKECNDKK